jgi:transposase-like protein
MTFLDFERRLPTDLDAINYYINIRYKGIYKCFHCGSEINIYRYQKNPKVFHCNKCNTNFSPFKGTIFEKSRTSMKIWLYAIHLMLNNPQSISSCQLKRETGVTQKCAYRILQQLRKDVSNIDHTETFKFFIETNEIYTCGNLKWCKGKQIENKNSSDEIKKIPMDLLSKETTIT